MMFNENGVRNVSFGINEVKYMDGDLTIKRADAILRNLIELYKMGIISETILKKETSKVYNKLLNWDFTIT